MSPAPGKFAQRTHVFALRAMLKQNLGRVRAHVRVDRMRQVALPVRGCVPKRVRRLWSYYPKRFALVLHLDVENTSVKTYIERVRDRDRAIARSLTRRIAVFNMGPEWVCYFAVDCKYRADLPASRRRVEHKRVRDAIRAAGYKPGHRFMYKNTAPPEVKEQMRQYAEALVVKVRAATGMGKEIEVVEGMLL